MALKCNQSPLLVKNYKTEKYTTQQTLQAETALIPVYPCTGKRAKATAGHFLVKAI